LDSGRRFQFKGKAELLEEGNLYNDVVCYLQTLPLKLPDRQYVVKIKVEEVYHLGLGNKTTTPSSTRGRHGSREAIVEKVFGWETLKGLSINT